MGPEEIKNWHGNVKDHTGKKYGKLTGIKRTGSTSAGDSRWLWECDCGTIKEIPAGNVVSGNTKSCGCVKRKDYAGKKYGSLTGVKFVRGVSGNSVWLWRCDCGNTKEIRVGHVKCGRTVSCGCSRLKDYTNKRYGMLVGIKPLETKKEGKTIWLWRCDCGNTKEVPPFQVTSGYTRSCGCEKFNKQKEFGTVKEEFPDIVVKARIKIRTGINDKDITNEIIELKRSQLMLNRALKAMKPGVK